MVDAIPLLCNVEDRAAVHWCVVVPDVEEGAARVELVSVVEGEDARKLKLVVPARTKFRFSKLGQTVSWRRYVA